MANVHVVSCGTSVLSNIVTRYRARFPFLPTEIKTVDDLVTVLNTNSSLMSEVEPLVHASPYEFFAEVKAMRPFLEGGEVDVVYLIGTKTPAAQLAIRLLHRYFESLDISIDPGAQFVGFEPGSDDVEEDRIAQFAADLQVLRAKALAYVRRRQSAGDVVFIGAQGGYKPEAGILMLVGSETQATTYYAHEQMDRTVTIPLLSYRGAADALRAIATHGRHVAGPAATSLWRQHQVNLQAAEEAFAVQLRRDRGTGEVVMIKLTDYGKFLAETST